MEMKDKGFNIDIIEEMEFVPAMKKIIENKIEETSTDEVCVENAWQNAVRDMLEKLVAEYELPVGSLYLSDNYGQSTSTRNKLISHTVCIWEPDYPPVANEKPGKNKLVVTIVPSKLKSRPDELVLNIRETQEGDLHAYLPKDAEILKQTSSDRNAGMVRVCVDKNSPNLVEYIRQNTIYCVNGYVSKADRFGCCSNFEKCSDAKKCVHENKLYSKACMYRDNLDQGQIFYGKNQNIKD